MLTLIRSLLFEAAKKENINLVEEILSKFSVCIDIREGIFNTLIQLAYKEEHPAVEFLIKYFNANINSAVQGYAMCGDTKAVKNLLQRGAKKNAAVLGYAIGGSSKLVKDLLKEGANINWAVQGFGIGGHFNALTDLLKDGADINWAVQGFASGGHSKAVKNLLNDGADINWAVNGFAIGGYAKEVQDLLDQGANKDWAAHGFAIGNHIQDTKELLNDGADINWIVQGFAIGGDTNSVNQLLKNGANMNLALQGYVKGGHISPIENLLIQGADIKIIKPLFNTSENNIIKILTLVSSDKIRHAMAQIAGLVNNISYEPLYNKSYQLHHRMKNYSLNYHQAYAFSSIKLYWWFYYGLQGMKSEQTILPPNIFFLIASFLSPLPLNTNEMEKLAHAVTFNLHRKLLTLDLEIYHQSIQHSLLCMLTLGFFGKKLTSAEKHHKKNVRFFLENIKKTSSNEELQVELINEINQINDFTTTKNYEKKIDLHLWRSIR